MRAKKRNMSKSDQNEMTQKEAKCLVSWTS